MKWKKYLEKIAKKGEMVTLCTRLEYTGFVLQMTSYELLLQQIEWDGSANGQVLLKLDDITSCASGTPDTKKRTAILQEWKQSEKLKGTMLSDELLEHAIGRQSIALVSGEEYFSGWVRSYSQDYILLDEMTAYGEEDGELLFRREILDALETGSEELKGRERLWRKKIPGKKEVSFLTFEDGMRQIGKKEFCEIYTVDDLRHCEVGKILFYKEGEFLMQSIARDGADDGYAVLQEEDVACIYTGAMYPKKLTGLNEKRKDSRSTEICFEKNVTPSAAVLKYAEEQGCYLLVDVNGRNLYGMVRAWNEETIKLENVNQYGIREGCSCIEREYVWEIWIKNTELQMMEATCMEQKSGAATGKTSLKEMAEEKEMVTLYADREYTGFVLQVTEEELLLQQIERDGSDDGRLVLSLDTIRYWAADTPDIRRIQSDLKEIEKKPELPGEHLSDALLEDAVGREPVFIFCEERDYCGWVMAYSEEFILLNAMTAYGEDDGEMLFRREELDALEIESAELKIRRSLWKKEIPKKKKVGFQTFADGLRAIGKETVCEIYEANNLESCYTGKLLGSKEGELLVQNIEVGGGSDGYGIVCEDNIIAVFTGGAYLRMFGDMQEAPEIYMNDVEALTDAIIEYAQAQECYILLETSEDYFYGKIHAWTEEQVEINRVNDYGVKKGRYCINRNEVEKIWIKSQKMRVMES